MSGGEGKGLARAPWMANISLGLICAAVSVLFFGSNCKQQLVQAPTQVCVARALACASSPLRASAVRDSAFRVPWPLRRPGVRRALGAPAGVRPRRVGRGSAPVAELRQAALRWAAPSGGAWRPRVAARGGHAWGTGGGGARFPADRASLSARACALRLAPDSPQSSPPKSTRPATASFFNGSCALASC